MMHKVGIKGIFLLESKPSLRLDYPSFFLGLVTRNTRGNPDGITSGRDRSDAGRRSLADSGEL